MPDASQTGLVEIQQGKWAAAGLHHQFLCIVFDAPSRDSARAMVEGVRMQLDVKP
jgi:hypothetical protein